MSETGKCLCGAVTYTAEDVQPHFHACHCSMCRRWSGGPGFAVAVSSVTISGEENMVAYKSSDWAERCFCKQCGSNLFYRMPESGTTMVQTGSFDDESKFQLDGEIYVDEATGGYAFTGDHPRQTGAEFLASLGIEEPSA